MKKFLVIVLGMLFVFGLSTMSWAGVELKISDTTKATVGFKGLIWAQSAQDAITTDKGTNDKIDFAVRQFRFYTSGQVTPLVKFGANLDWSAGAWDGTLKTPSATVTDASMTLAFAPEVNIMAGLYRTPFSRIALQDGYQGIFVHGNAGVARGSYVGVLGNYRNAGLTLWGDAMGGKIKYGAGIFDGDLVPGTAVGYPTDDSPFYSVRLAFSPLTPEKGYANAGTYLGKQKGTVLTIGGGYLAAKYRTATPSSASITYATTAKTTGTTTTYETKATTTAAGSTTTAEPTYTAYTVDAFAEIPLGGGALTVEGAYFNYDWGNVADPVTKGYYGQIAYLIGGVNIQPAFRYESSDKDGTVTGGDDFSAYAVGLNYYMKGHDAKINLEYAKKDFENEGTTKRTNQDYADITLQLQFQF